MVGDSQSCDGGSEQLGIKYLKVNVDEKLWIDEFWSEFKKPEKKYWI